MTAFHKPRMGVVTAGLRTAQAARQSVILRSVGNYSPQRSGLKFMPEPRNPRLYRCVAQLRTAVLPRPVVFMANSKPPTPPTVGGFFAWLGLCRCQQVVLVESLSHDP